MILENGWWVGTHSTSKKYSRDKKPFTPTVVQPFFCPICEDQWDIDHNKGSKDISEYYPKGSLPTIGKERKICFKCENIVRMNN
jgi:hypothetical protein